MVSIVPSAQMTRRRYGAGKLWVAPLGTVTSNYAPTGTGGSFTQGTTATQVPGNAAWLPVGITSEGTTFTFSFDTDTDEAAEYNDALATIVTGTSATMEAELKTVNLTNLRAAFNLPTSLVTGTPTASTAAYIDPPAAGAEVRSQWLWESTSGNHIILFWQGLNTGDVALQGQKGAGGMNIPISVNAELPDVSVAPRAWRQYVIGTSFAESVGTE